jgi:hypothetical protein
MKQKENQDRGCSKREAKKDFEKNRHRDKCIWKGKKNEALELARDFMTYTSFWTTLTNFSQMIENKADI